MNKRLKELAEQAGFDKHHAEYDTRIERFDELVRQDEREAVIDIVARHGGSIEIESAIRQRGEK
jgi:hypothetical protein